VATLALLPLTLLLTITVVGIPVVVAMYAALVVLIPLGLVVVANVIGLALPIGRRRVHRTQAMVLALGLFAMLLVMRIPVLGPAVLVAAARRPRACRCPTAWATRCPPRDGACARAPVPSMKGPCAALCSPAPCLSSPVATPPSTAKTSPPR